MKTKIRSLANTVCGDFPLQELHFDCLFASYWVSSKLMESCMFLQCCPSSLHDNSCSLKDEIAYFLRKWLGCECNMYSRQWRVRCKACHKHCKYSWVRSVMQACGGDAFEFRIIFISYFIEQITRVLMYMLSTGFHLHGITSYDSN